MTSTYTSRFAIYGVVDWQTAVRSWWRCRYTNDTTSLDRCSRTERLVNTALEWWTAISFTGKRLPQECCNLWKI